MLGCIKDTIFNMALSKLKNSVINPKLAGIGTVDNLVWCEGSLHAELRLTGLENIPVEINCNKVCIAPDGSSVTLHDVTSDMPFMQNALRMFVDGKAISVPEGVARTALVGAKKALGL